MGKALQIPQNNFSYTESPALHREVSFCFLMGQVVSSLVSGSGCPWALFLPQDIVSELNPSASLVIPVRNEMESGDHVLKKSMYSD